MDYSEELHLVYNATASPSDKNNETVNESPDVSPLSWECSTTSVNIPGFKAASHITFYKHLMDQADWEALLDLVWGCTTNDATLPTPAQVISMFGGGYTYTALATEPDDWETKYYEKYYTKYGSKYTLIPRQDEAPTFVTGQYYERDDS